MSLILLFQAPAAGAAVALDGSLAGTTSASAAITRARPLVGSAAAVSDMAATLLKYKTLSASISAISALQDGSIARAAGLTGSMTASTGITGTIERARTLAALLSSTGAFSGTVTKYKGLAAALVSTSGSTANLKRAQAPVIADTNTSTLSASIRATLKLAGTRSSTSTWSADLTRMRFRQLAATLSGATVLANGQLQVARDLTGGVSGAVSYIPRLTRGRPLTGDVSASGTIITAPLLRARSISGDLSSVSTLSVPGITRIIDLLGLATSSASFTSTLHRDRVLTGQEASTSGLTAGLVRARGMTGGASGTSSLGPVVLNRNMAHLSGLLDAVSGEAGVLGLPVLLSGAAQATTSLVASRINRLLQVEGSSISHAEVTASTFSLLLSLVGQVAGEGTLSAQLKKITELNGQLNGLAVINPSSLRVTDGLPSLTVTFSWETWERVDDNTAMLVEHVSQPFTVATRIDIYGQVVEAQ